MELASKLFDNLHRKLLTLPDFCEVYPAHGVGSLCGRSMGAKRTSTIGYERKYNAALQILDKSKFIESLTTNMPAAPDHFARCSAINAAGPRLLRDLPALAPMAAKSFAGQARKPGAIVLDIRTADAFGGQHVPGAWHIDYNGNFATFAGWMLPPDNEILLVSDNDVQAKGAAILLRRVGLDAVTGYLDGGMSSWNAAGLPTEHISQLGPQELKHLLDSNSRMVLVDVRSVQEFEMAHIPGAKNIPSPDMRKRHRELPGDTPIAVICGTGMRSSLAASILQRNGFKDVKNVAGGMNGYLAAGCLK
jgi:rhodanese-related sulfurtransferase